MNSTLSLLRYCPLALFAAAVLATGCAPRNVEVLGVTGPDRLETDESGTFVVETNEDAKPPVSLSWDFGDSQSGDGASASHAFSSAGNYTVTVTATNRRGKGMDTGSKTVLVVDPPVPAQVITILANPSDPDTQTPVRFSANVRGDAPLSYSWSFGDGGTDGSPTPTHVFSEAGTYTVSLDVSNAAGRDARTMQLSVAPFEADYCADLAEMVSVFFDRNSSVLTASGQESLADNVDIMQDCPNLNVRVEGVASPFERNPQSLSDDRARAVMQHYVDAGVNASRISTQGLGRPDGGSKKSGAEQFRRADTIPLH